MATFIHIMLGAVVACVGFILVRVFVWVCVTISKFNKIKYLVLESEYTTNNALRYKLLDVERRGKEMVLTCVTYNDMDVLTKRVAALEKKRKKGK